MKTTHFFASAAKATFVLAAVCTLSFAPASCSKSDDNAPEEPETPANTVTIDGAGNPIVKAEIEQGFLERGNYDIYLILSEGTYINIRASQEHHDGKTIDLTKKEAEHTGWYWAVGCKYNSKIIFDALGTPGTPHTVFITGTLYVKRHADANGKPVFEIVLKNGKVKDRGMFGDDKEYTVSFYWKGSPEFLNYM